MFWNKKKKVEEKKEQAPIKPVICPYCKAEDGHHMIYQDLGIGVCGSTIHTYASTTYAWGELPGLILNLIAKYFVAYKANQAKHELLIEILAEEAVKPETKEKIKEILK